MLSHGDSEEFQRQETDQDDYNEEEDEDFDPTKVQEASDEENEDEESKTEQHLSKSGKDYSHIESETGGLIRTRKARQLEEERLRRHKYETLEVESVSETSGKLWEDLKNQGVKRLNGREHEKSVLSMSGEGSGTVSSERQILIKREYKFAGEMIHEEKMVPISSAEAKEYLNSIKFQSRLDIVGKKYMASGVDGRQENIKNNLRRPLKRPALLEQIISGAIKPKLTTLEKSSLDWASYVDKEGINEELSLHNKDGYLAKQDFLNQVESHKDQQYKQLRQKQLSMQLQDGAKY